MAEVFYIPNGPKNLKALFPALDFTQITEYTVQVLSISTAGTPGQAIIDVTPLAAWEPGTVVNVNIVIDPLLGPITLGTYITVVGDNVASVLAQHLAVYIQSLILPAAFAVTYSGNTVICDAPQSYGSLINGQLFVLDWTADSLNDEFGGGTDDIQTAIATSPLNINERVCNDDIHIHFINYEGCPDSAIFKLIDIQSGVKSESFQISTRKPLIKNVHGINRTDIRVNEINQAQGIFDESEMDWLQELFHSPFTWIEWAGIQGQPDDYIPIVLGEQKLQKKKREDRFEYLVDLEFIPSNPKIVLRG